MRRPAILAASLAALAATALAGCSGGSSQTRTSVAATTTASSAATTVATTAPAATTTTSASTPAATAAVTSASTTTAAPATTPTTAPAASPGVDFVRDAQAILPGADPGSLEALGELVCTTLDDQPSAASVEGIVSGLVNQSGLQRPQALKIVGLAVRSGCPAHTGLL